MSRTRRPLCRALVALALGAVACGGGQLPVAQEIATPRAVAAADPAEKEQPHGRPAASGNTDAVDPGSSSAAAPDAKPASSQAANEQVGGGTQPGRQSTADKRAGGGGNEDRPSPDIDAFDVTAIVEPACVRAGGTTTITITTEPHASVAYNAIYSDGQAGAPPPFGANYGGNAGGFAGEQGHYQDTWTVAANAPAGPGHVDVVAGLDGGFGKTSVPFAVADPITGGCDQ